MEIIREKYLSDIRRFYDSNLINREHKYERFARRRAAVMINNAKNARTTQCNSTFRFDQIKFQGA